MNYYGQLPWLLWFAWFYSWYLVIKRFILNCKVLSIKEKTSQRKAGKSSSVFKLWRVFEQVCFDQLTSYADLTQTPLHSVGDSAVSKTEKTPVHKASAGLQGERLRGRGLGDGQLQAAWSPALPTEGQTGRPLSSAYTSWHPVTARRRSHSSPLFPSGVSASPRFPQPPSFILETQLHSSTALLSPVPFSFCISPQRTYSLPRGQPSLPSC